MFSMPEVPFVPSIGWNPGPLSLSPFPARRYESDLSTCEEWHGRDAGRLHKSNSVQEAVTRGSPRRYWVTHINTHGESGRRPGRHVPPANTSSAVEQSMRKAGYNHCQVSGIAWVM